MADVMRVGFWIVLLLVSAGVLVAAFEAQPEVEAEPDDETHAVAGITGQRQRIDFDIAPDRTVRGFDVALYHHCSSGDEWRTDWYPSYAVPAPFERRRGWLHLSERADAKYGGGRTGTGVARMVARRTSRGVEGRLRSVWRFERNGKEYVVCDTGFVPFAAGPGAHRRVGGIEPTGEPWSLYPEPLEVIAQLSPEQSLFAARLDATCARTSRHRPSRGGYAAFVRWHAGQLAALRRMGRPPDGWASHALWLAKFEQRVALERKLVALPRGGLEAAARLNAMIARLIAEGNAAGLAFGLRTCTSNGPTGAPKTPPTQRRPAEPPPATSAA
jgi:hypothetical protein